MTGYGGRNPIPPGLVATDTSHRISYAGTGMGFLLLILAAGLVPGLGYLIYQIALDPVAFPPAGLLLIAGLVAPFVWLLLWGIKEFTASLEMTATGLTKKSLYGSHSVSWSEIASVTTTRLTSCPVVHTRSGRKMTLPHFWGSGGDVVECLQRYLPRGTEQEDLINYHRY